MIQIGQQNPADFNEFGTPPANAPESGNGFDWDNFASSAFGTIANILFGPKTPAPSSGGGRAPSTQSDSTKWIIYAVSALLVIGIITAVVIVLKKK